jgi:hypothetical protein
MELTLSWVAMADEIMVAIASALAGKAADAVAGAAQEAWSRLVRLVRDRFRGDAGGRAALETARSQPDDRDVVHELAERLEEAAAVDPPFAAELRALWLEVGPHISATGASAVNVATGSVGGHLIQARDLHIEGGLHLGDVQGPASPESRS